jgi:hypothetical protein
VLTVAGDQNFGAQDVIYWKGNPLLTTVVAAQTVQATIPLTAELTAGTVPVFVRTERGGDTNSLTFTVSAPAGGTYTITTTPEREQALAFSFQHYAGKVAYPDQAAYFQAQVDKFTSDPMVVTYVRAHSVALDQSVATIPAEERPAAAEEIADVIVAHGGHIVSPGDPNLLGLPPMVPPAQPK